MWRTGTEPPRCEVTLHRVREHQEWGIERSPIPDRTASVPSAMPVTIKPYSMASRCALVSQKRHGVAHDLPPARTTNHAFESVNRADKVRIGRNRTAVAG